MMQSDHLLPFLTVEETLRFAAHLRLPPETSRAERESRVADVIAELGLQLCKHTLVGSKEVKGISGGEKRRSERKRGETQTGESEERRSTRQTRAQHSVVTISRCFHRWSLLLFVGSALECRCSQIHPCCCSTNRRRD